MPPQVVFSTPRKLPHPSEVPGRVAVLDIAFAGQGRSAGFDKVTQPFIQALGSRLRVWVDHHDHDEHARFASDPRFVLATKAEHGACPEMISPELVERIGAIDTIVCHTDFDGLASAAKWMRGGIEPYPGCDDDARAIDTRLGQPSRTAERIDQALRARPRDMGLFGLVVRHLAAGVVDAALWEPIDAAGAEWRALEAETRRLAKRYQRLPAGVAFLEIDKADGRYDKTLLLLLGQEREPVSVVAERDTVSVAARFDSGLNFVKLLGLAGGMPTRVAVPRSRLSELLSALGVDHAALDYR
ncbi:MAG TPA: hypothetical protein VG963_16030 [Polyangiaceae bacterium]|nr:hypothetical protein [Polyangiaceae bacterium]